MDQSVKRSNKRAALDQFWTTQTEGNLALTTVGSSPYFVKSDGADLWAANFSSNTVSRVRASDGRLLETWTEANNAYGVLVAMGKIFVTGETNPGSLYQIDPTQPAGAVTALSTTLPGGPTGIAFDGQRIWMTDDNAVLIVTLNPFTVTPVATGFGQLGGIIYDGTNIWVSDFGVSKLKKLDSFGNILMSVDVGNFPGYLAFDGTNIWVPNKASSTVSVVRATGSPSGTVLATLTGNGLNFPADTAFDGERILVTNNSGSSVSLWRASDLTPIGTFSTGAGSTPWGTCSDGLNFWITLQGTAKLARF
jgi:hypothetical protein